jgi:transposase
MAELGRKTKRYPSDLTDEESSRIEPLLPKPSRRAGGPRSTLREVLNAIRYVARNAGGWRMLPVHFGPWQTVYWWFLRFVRRLPFRTIHDVALMRARRRAAAGRAPADHRAAAPRARSGHRSRRCRSACCPGHSSHNRSSMRNARFSRRLPRTAAASSPGSFTALQIARRFVFARASPISGIQSASRAAPRRRASSWYAPPLRRAKAPAAPSIRELGNACILRLAFLADGANG